MAGPVRRAAGVALALAALLPPPRLAAQDSAAFRAPRQAPAVARYGKWLTLGAALGMGVLAARAHADAEHAFDRLERYCFLDPVRCDLAPDGRYLDPLSENYYQATVRADRRARGWLFGGEGAMLVTAGLLVWELAHPRAPPDNIPFAPHLSVGQDAARLGVSLAF